MKPPTNAWLAQTGGGRIVLHLLTLRRDRHLGWHLAGVARELKRMVREFELLQSMNKSIY
jgi:hypothetical protein